MRSQIGTVPYAEVNGTQAVDLPYIGEEVSLLVILPPEGEFESYEQPADSTELTRFIDTLDARDGTVSLPRFEFESGLPSRTRSKR